MEVTQMGERISSESMAKRLSRHLLPKPKGRRGQRGRSRDVAKQLLMRRLLPLGGDHITTMSKEEFKVSFFKSHARSVVDVFAGDGDIFILVEEGRGVVGGGLGDSPVVCQDFDFSGYEFMVSAFLELKKASPDAPYTSAPTTAVASTVPLELAHLALQSTAPSPSKQKEKKTYPPPSL
ncbi:hypothetical protein NE237_024943 [Protea cynaroides]|uniref:Uncharacterized protein n=1 Tax=Protea cynaroides TaxID=273540 RepID=A0A9Q0H0Z7_9MAGN|nr:hypothetical protein NE237_024943 [Protea cynaroides]